MATARPRRTNSAGEKAYAPMVVSSFVLALNDTSLIPEQKRDLVHKICEQCIKDPSICFAYQDSYIIMSVLKENKAFVFDKGTDELRRMDLFLRDEGIFTQRACNFSRFMAQIFVNALPGFSKVVPDRYALWLADTLLGLARKLLVHASEANIHCAINMLESTFAPIRALPTYDKVLSYKVKGVMDEISSLLTNSAMCAQMSSTCMKLLVSFNARQTNKRVQSIAGARPSSSPRRLVQRNPYVRE